MGRSRVSGDNRARAVEEAPGPLGYEPDHGVEEGGGLRRTSEAVALVSASALVGGGIGMLGGDALGAINPFALGIIGAAAGAGVPVLFAVGALGSWWRRVFGG